MSRYVQIAIAVLFLIIASVSTVLAQELDDLLNVPDDTVEGSAGSANTGDESEPSTDDDQASESGDSIDVDALLGGGTRVSGTFSFQAGGVAGIRGWGSLTGNSALADSLDASPVLDSKISGSLSVRPTSYYSLDAVLASSLSTSDLSFSLPAFQRLSFDYIVGGRYLFRIGRHGPAWGHGQLLGNPGNLIAEVASSYSAMLSAPLGNHSLTVLGFSNAALLEFGGLRNFGYAGQLQVNLDRAVVETAIAYRYPNDLKHSLYVKTTLFSLDVSSETVVSWNLYGAATSQPYDVVQTTGVLYENADAGYVILAEHELNYTFSAELYNEVAIGLIATDLRIAGWRPGFRWLHAFGSSEGQIVPAVTRTVLPMVSMDLALPINYGADLSRYSQVGWSEQTWAAGLVVTLRISDSF